MNHLSVAFWADLMRSLIQEMKVKKRPAHQAQNCDWTLSEIIGLDDSTHAKIW